MLVDLKHVLKNSASKKRKTLSKNKINNNKPVY
jgi:hypothetical protein